MAAEALQKNLLRWVKAGVKITLGSDAGGVPIFFHGENAQELQYMVKLGLSPLDAIIASTRHSMPSAFAWIDESGQLSPVKKRIY